MTAPTTLTRLSWPLCVVLPFPLVRRRSLVERTAHSMAFRGFTLGSKDPVATGEKLLLASLKAQRELMQRRGVDPETIAREWQKFEPAVRCLAARLRVRGIGSASWRERVGEVG